MAPKRHQPKGKKNEATQSKRKKYEAGWNQFEETPNDAVRPITIIDLNDDCLEHIFNYLSVVDLLNLADVSTRFGEAIELSSKTRSVFKTLQLTDIKYRPRKKLTENNHYCAIYDLTTCLKYLRCFGHQVEALNIVYKKIAQNHCAEMDRYINEYCGETLSLLYVHNAEPYSMNNFKKTFSEVSRVEFHKCEFDPQLMTKFGKLFPKAYTLRFYGGNKKANSKCFASHISSLTDLSVELVTIKEDESKIGKTDIGKLLRLNPQIEELSISGKGWDAKKLQDISDDLNVRSLNVRCSLDFFNLKRGTLHLENIENLVINDYSNGKFPRILLSFGHLEDLTIYTQREANDNLMNFIAQQKSLKKLTLSFCDFDNEKALKKMMFSHQNLQKVLQSLKSLNLGLSFCTDEIIQILDKCKMLDDFTFNSVDNWKLDSLKKRLPAEWLHDEYYDNIIVLLRTTSDAGLRLTPLVT